MALMTITATSSESGGIIERTSILRDKNSLFSNLSNAENNATPDATEASSDDDSDAEEEFIAEEDHPNNYSCAQDIAMMGAEQRKRPKKTVRFMLPPVEEKQQTQVILRKTKRHVPIRQKRNAEDCGFHDLGYLNTTWILDILLCV